MANERCGCYKKYFNELNGGKRVEKSISHGQFFVFERVPQKPNEKLRDIFTKMY